MTSPTGTWGTPDSPGQVSGFGVPGGPPTMIRPDLPPTAPEAYGLTYWAPGTPGWPPLASPGKRFLAVLLEALLYVVTLGIGWFIWQFFTWSNGQTPAKSILKMRVVATTTGRPATWGHMIVREWVVKGLTTGFATWLVGGVLLGIGLATDNLAIVYLGIFAGFAIELVAITLIFGAFRQTLWDRIIHTVVVDESKTA